MSDVNVLVSENSMHEVCTTIERCSNCGTAFPTLHISSVAIVDPDVLEMMGSTYQDPDEEA